MSEIESTEQDPIEAKAISMGWKPATEFDGDEAEFVGAKEFIGRKPLFDKIHDQSRKLTSLEQTLKDTALHVQKIGEVAYKKAVADLQKERKEAVTNSDIDAVESIDSQLNDLKETVQVQQGPPPEYVAWAQDNPWFNSDPELYSFACAAYDAHVKKNPNDTDLKAVLANVTKVVKRAYPEKFGGAQPAAHNAVEGSARPSSVKSGPSYSNLSPDQKRVCDTFVKAGVMSKEAYVKSLVEIGEL